VKELRDILVVNGWRADDDGNFSVVVEPEGKFAIAVATGDEATGTEKAPKTKYEKGVRTLAAVEQNQMLLFVEQLQKAEQSGRETWVLLRRRDPGTHTLMAELSLPAGVVGNRIVKWSVRIILDPIDLDPNPNRMTPSGGDGGGGEDVDVPVTRRTSN
jgi:hypothetical protein